MAPQGQLRLELIEDIKKAALLHGEFTLRSGKKSNYYLDKYLFGTDPKILESLVPYIIEKLPASDSYDRLAGPELGAITLTTAVALKTGKPFVLVRKQSKEYGTAKEFEGRLEKGERVVLIEDILTTAGAALSAAERLRAWGVEIVKIVGIIDRQEGARENIEKAGFKMDAVLTKTDLGIA